MNTTKHAISAAVGLGQGALAAQAIGGIGVAVGGTAFALPALAVVLPVAAVGYALSYAANSVVDVAIPEAPVKSERRTRPSVPPEAWDTLSLAQRNRANIYYFHNKCTLQEAIDHVLSSEKPAYQPTEAQVAQYKKAPIRKSSFAEFSASIDAVQESDEITGLRQGHL